MDILGEIQLILGHINSRFNSMDEQLDSLGAQVAVIDRNMSLGASVEEIHGNPAQSRSSKTTQSPPYAWSLHIICISSVYMHLLVNSVA